jgi:hypothetical protein
MTTNKTKTGQKNKIDIKTQIVVISLVSILFILYFNFIFHKYYAQHDYIYFSMVNLVFMPIILISYFTYYEITHIQNDVHYKTVDHFIQEFNSTEKIADLLPVILFGIALLITPFSKSYKLLTVTSSYLLFAVLFGSIIPYMLKHIIFDYNNLDRLIIINHLCFITMSMCYSLIIMSLVIPVFTIYKKKNVS